jgi:hypothetical protein
VQSPSVHSPYHGIFTVPIPSSPQSLSRHFHSPYRGLCTVPITVSTQPQSQSLHSPYHGLCTVPFTESTQPLSWSLHIPFRRLFILPMPASVTLDPRKQGPQQCYIKVIHHNRKINQTRYAIENCALLGQTTPEDGTDKLSRNAGEKLPLLAA